MAYRADIEIAVRGARKLKDLQNEIKRTSEAVSEITKEINSVGNLTAVTFKSLSSSLSDARQAFNDAARGTDSFGTAINTLIRTEREYNNELRERNSLLAQARATQTAAARTISPGQTGFSAERFGPQVPAGTGRQGDPAFASSPVAERLTQQLSDQAKLKASLLALDEKSAAAAQERLNLSTQLKEELNEIKVAAKIGPREPEGFSKAANQKKVDDNVRRQQIMKEGAEFAAQQEANRKKAIESHNKVAQFAKKNEAAVFGIRAKNIRRALDLEFDKITKQAAAEGKAADKLIAERISDNRKAEADFDKRLDRRTKAKIKAAKDVRKAEKRIASEDSGKVAAGRKKRNDAISSGLIGGAFPLLFGQGGGAAIGGGIGGFAGGLAGGQMGFALSLVGTQFGAFADQIVSGGATLGQALNPLTADIEALAEAAGFAGTETGVAIQAIEQLGTQQQALEAATALLAATVGNEGVDALTNFGANTADLGREFARAMTLMQTAAARLFQSIPETIANVIRDANDLQAGLKLDTPEAKVLQDKINELTLADTVGAASGMGGLSEDESKELLKAQNALRAIVRGQVVDAEQLTKATSEQLQTTKFLSEFGLKNAAITKTELELASMKKDLTDADYVTLLKIKAAQDLSLKNTEAEKTATDINNKNKSQFLKTNGSLEKVQNKNLIEFNNKIAQIDRDSEAAIDRKNKKIEQGAAKLGKQKDIVPGLKIQVQLQERLLGLNTKIAEAKRNGNEGAAAVLEVEKIFEKTAANIDKIKTEGLSKDAEALKIEEAQLKGLQQVEAVNNRMRDAKAKEAEKVEELVGNLENEGALIKAKLAGREDEVKLTQKIAEKTEGLGEADAKRVADLIRGNAELTKQVAIADKMQQIYDQIGQSIASGVVDTLSAAVDQTKSLADAAANTLRNIANILLQLGINTALQGTGLGIFKNLGGFADGGRPPVGKPSIVGERGPELFVPNTSGTIVPNNKLGGGGATNVVVNVDAKGSSASGDSGAGKQLGGLIGAAVQAELIKQQRPGGLLSR